MKQLTIRDMDLIAAKRGGKCLSRECGDSKTKLNWQCAQGHRWAATAANVRRGKWCPKCAGVAKLSIVDAQRSAMIKGGRLVSTEYTNSRTNMLWECKHGHRWSACLGSIKAGSWCPKCAGVAKGTIEEMKQVAIRRGGKCLSKHYVNRDSKLRWECARGHQWDATPVSVVKGKHWCPHCAGTVKGSIEDMRHYAHQHGGMCLSKSYTNAQTKLLWQCADGHKWEATPNAIQGGQWCPYCAGNAKLTIKMMIAMARKRGGRCLSSNYINSVTKLRWRCAEGHTWMATPSMIRSGNWCPRCAGKEKLTIAAMRKLAITRGGKCLSTEYRSRQSKLRWQCAHVHQWEAAPSSIQRGRWCPECSSGLGERICRAYFEQLFCSAFPKSRPDWLRTENGNRMELDGYSAALGIAFEHQGDQHFKELAFFRKGRKGLQVRQAYDEWKRKLCNQHGVKLIEVPEIPGRLLPQDVRKHIAAACRDLGIILPHDFGSKNIALMSAYTTSRAVGEMRRLREIVSRRKGKCLSGHYTNDTTKMDWQCEYGHQFAMTPGSVKAGQWCPRCVHRVPLTLDEMKALAKSKGGQCLSKRYVTALTPLRWECAKGHQWRAAPASIKSGHWCPHCAGNVRHTIEMMRELATKRGGRCVSKKYVSSNAKLRWECREGHQWDATPAHIKTGTWCPYCGNKLKGKRHSSR